MNAQFIFIPLQKFIVMIILLIISYQCTIISEMTLNKSIHGPNCNKTFSSIIYNKHQCTVHLLCIVMKSEFILSHFWYNGSLVWNDQCTNDYKLIAAIQRKWIHVY